MYVHVHTYMYRGIYLKKNSGGKSGLEGVVTWKYNSFLY